MPPVEPTVIFEDGWLLAIDKPAGMLAHAEGTTHSALAWAQAREAKAQRDPVFLHLVHRLDRQTSGVLLFARGKAIAEAVNALFRDRKVLKMYVALCSPVPTVRWLKVDQLLKPERIGSGERMQVVAEGGIEASCEIEVLARGRRFAVVRVIPDQGRKHQVRVALAASGSPIAGDFLYGGALSRQLAPRVMLHARSLQFSHPHTQEHLILFAALPSDLKKLVADDGGTLPTNLDARHRAPVAKHGRAPLLALPKINNLAGAAALPQPRSYARAKPAGGQPSPSKPEQAPSKPEQAPSKPEQARSKLPKK